MQAAAGLDKKNRHIVFRIVRRIRMLPLIAIMTRVQTSVPFGSVEFAESADVFTHVATLQHGAAAGNKPYGVSAGMGVDAKKGFLRHGYSLATVLYGVPGERVVDRSPEV